MASHYNIEQIENPSKYLTQDLVKLKNTFAKQLAKNDIPNALITFEEFNKNTTDHFIRAIWIHETTHYTQMTTRSKPQKFHKSIPLNLDTFLFVRTILTQTYYEPNIETYFNILQERHALKPKPLEKMPTKFTILTIPPHTQIQSL